MNILQTLNWRYATKRMTGAKIPAEKLETILEAIRLSASSVGLQPYNVLVITDPALKAKLHATAIKQPQVLEASAVLVFAAWASISENHVTEYINLIARERNIEPTSLDGFKNSILPLVTSRSAEENFQWAARQAYIALGTGLVAAAAEQVDATPMEGFDANAVDEVLGLAEKNLRTAVVMTLGYRDEANDPLASAKKVRRPEDQFFIRYV